jgi:hypothetical protein
LVWQSAQARTNYRYKQTVRMFKNARNCAIERKLISDSCAPSYFVECALYNVLDDQFTPNRQQTFLNVHNYLSSTIQIDKAICQNGQLLLFGNSPEQWDVKKAAEFAVGLSKLWNNW